MFELTGVAPLIIEWASSSWGVGMAFAIFLMGAIIMLPSGTPLSTVEGALIACSTKYLLPELANVAPVIQGAVLLCWFFWLATFSFLSVRFLKSGARSYVEWDNLSFMVLLGDLKRPKHAASGTQA